jgi:UDP-N-acetylglucosamine--N-acetylmuramyl-(pentapeptide) pyrophosphoryl-undecaprenol N-acetylglucosamine transferase
VYPALAVLSALGNDASSTLWVGGEGGMEAELVQRAGIPFSVIPAAGVHGVGLLRLPANLWRLWRGYLASRRIIRKFKPDVLFFTGGYLAVPVAFAGRKLPILLYVPDIEPGMALRFLQRYANCIAVTAEETRQYFKPSARIEITGYPTRPELGKWEHSQALKHFGLQPELPVLFFFGGSKGARAINQAVFANLSGLLENAQIIHISGEKDWEQVAAAQASLPPQIANRYHPYPYLHDDMGAAFTCADLVISRAGASTLGELPLFGVPAILVPNVYFWHYQKVNADYISKHGGAVILPEDDLSSQLVPTVQALLANPQRLEELRQGMRSMALPNPARRIGELLGELAGSREAEREVSPC